MPGIKPIFNYTIPGIKLMFNYTIPGIKPIFNLTMPGIKLIFNYTTPGIKPIFNYTMPGIKPIFNYTMPGIHLLHLTTVYVLGFIFNFQFDFSLQSIRYQLIDIIMLIYFKIFHSEDRVLKSKLFCTPIVFTPYQINVSNLTRTKNLRTFSEFV